MRNFILLWKQYVRNLKTQIMTIALACKDPRTPCLVKVLAISIVAYACSPVDLIPDFIPILGYVDDLILLPLCIILILKMIPPVVLFDCKEKASQSNFIIRPPRYIAGFLVIATWLVGLLLIIRLVFHFYNRLG